VAGLLLKDYSCFTCHRLYVSRIAGKALGAVRRQQKTEDRRQRTEAKQHTATTIEDTGDLPRIGRQTGQVKLTSVDSTQLPWR